jgi:hypothetical protein
MEYPEFLGVLPDTRTPEQKEFDLTHPEIFSSSVATYLPSLQKASKYVAVFPVDNQYATSSCVAHGKVLATAIFMMLQEQQPFEQLASMFVYRNRSNYPQPGMVPALAIEQIEAAGAPIYADLPTPTTEAAANALTIDAATARAAKQLAGFRWITITDYTNIDTLAFVANSLNLPVNIYIYGTVAEWSQQTVDILTPGLVKGSPEAEVSHCVTVLPNSAYLANGKRYVIIQDSALFGDHAFRSVADTFIAARCYGADYPIAMDSQPIARPKVHITRDLTFGMTGPDVTALQEALQYLGCLPNVVDNLSFKPTNYYGGMTKSAVLQLQNAYAAEILAPNGLTAGTGYCGPSTRAFINSLFS